MDDKQVGELWLWVNAVEPDPSDKHYLQPDEGKALIRKLVEERAKFHAKYHRIESYYTLDQGEQMALCDFGIDSATWQADDKARGGK